MLGKALNVHMHKVQKKTVACKISSFYFIRKSIAKLFKCLIAFLKMTLEFVNSNKTWQFKIYNQEIWVLANK